MSQRGVVVGACRAAGLTCTVAGTSRGRPWSRRCLAARGRCRGRRRRSAAGRRRCRSRRGPGARPSAAAVPRRRRRRRESRAGWPRRFDQARERALTSSPANPTPPATPFSRWVRESTDRLRRSGSPPVRWHPQTNGGRAKPSADEEEEAPSWWCPREDGKISSGKSRAALLARPRFSSEAADEDLPKRYMLRTRVGRDPATASAVADDDGPAPRDPSRNRMLCHDSVLGRFSVSGSRYGVAQCRFPARRGHGPSPLTATAERNARQRGC